MSARRPIRIDLELPELTPAQADFLWTFLDDLASELWDAYESELLEVEEERSRPPDFSNDWTADDDEDLFENGSAPHDLVNDQDPDPDF